MFGLIDVKKMMEALDRIVINQELMYRDVYYSVCPPNNMLGGKYDLKGTEKEGEIHIFPQIVNSIHIFSFIDYTHLQLGQLIPLTHSKRTYHLHIVAGAYIFLFAPPPSGKIWPNNMLGEKND